MKTDPEEGGREGGEVDMWGPKTSALTSISSSSLACGEARICSRGRQERSRKRAHRTSQRTEGQHEGNGKKLIN